MIVNLQVSWDMNNRITQILFIFFLLLLAVIGKTQEASAQKLSPGAVYSVSFSPDGEQLAAAGPDTFVSIWDVNTRNWTALWPYHSESVSSVAFHPGGKFVFSTGLDGLLLIWDLRSDSIKVQEFPFSNPNVDPFSLTLSEDGKWLGYYNSVLIEISQFNESDGSLSFFGTIPGSRPFVFSPFDEIVASKNDRGEDNSIELWELKTGKRLRKLVGRANRLTALAFNPDGSILASGYEDRTIKLWDVQSGEDIQTLNGHQTSVSCLDFSPDGAILASGSYAGAVNGEIKLWHVKTGLAIQTIVPEAGDVNSVTFSPNGSFLASAHSDPNKYLNFWQLDEIESLKRIPFLNAFRNKGSLIFDELFEYAVKLRTVDLTETKIISVTSGWVFNITNIDENVFVTKYLPTKFPEEECFIQAMLCLRDSARLFDATILGKHETVEKFYEDNYTFIIPFDGWRPSDWISCMPIGFVLSKKLGSNKSECHERVLKHMCGWLLFFLKKNDIKRSAEFLSFILKKESELLMQELADSDYKETIRRLTFFDQIFPFSVIQIDYSLNNSEKANCRKYFKTSIYARNLLKVLDRDVANNIDRDRKILQLFK